MPTKPRFDPSQPFETVDDLPADKPRFDASKPFEVVAEELPPRPEPDKPMVQSAIEGVAGFPGYTVGSIPAVGPAVQLSPAALIETLAPKYAASKTQAPYRNYVEQERARLGEERRQYADEHPTFAMGGALVGAGMVPFKGKFLTPAAGAGMASRVGAGAANVAGRAAQAGAWSAADAAITGTGSAEAKGQEAAAISAGIDVGINALAKGVPAAGRLITGVKKATQEKYMRRAPQINAIDREQAIEQTTEALDSLTKPAVQAKEAAKDAADDLQNAKVLYRESLKEVAPPEQLGGQIADDLAALRKEVSEKSGEAFDVLAESGKTIKVAPLKGWLTSKMNKLKLSDGTIPPDLQDEVSKLAQYRDYLDELGDEVSAVDMKRIVQSLDAASERAYQIAKQPGGYVSRGDRTLIEFRRHIDQDFLKKIPEYEAAMKPVSESQKILKGVTDVFASNEDKIGEQLRRLKPAQKRELEALRAKTGNDYLAALKDYDDAREVLAKPSVFKERAAQLPEAQAMQAAEQTAEAAAKRAEPLKGWTPDRVEGILKQYQNEKGRSALTLRKKLDYLKRESGVDVSQIADDLAVKEALDQGFAHGSRNVNLGALSVGGMARGVANLVRGNEGAAGGFGSVAGAVIGAAADMIGPKVYKRMMDMSMNPAFDPYRRVLQDAARRGPNAVAIAHEVMMERDPVYGKLFAEEGE